jgi:hypothetical protein
MASPLQIVLNPENFEEAREAGGGGGRKDFFANRDREFVAHKAALMGQIDTISGVLAAQSQGPIGYVKVILKREAWAKSHRPVGTLFRSDRAPVVGGGDLGVMIVEGSPSGLAQIKAEIAKAETQTRIRFDETKGKEVPYPSPQKSETGAIERIELYGPSDKRRFSVEEAVTWLSNPMTGSGYEVELFDVLPPRPEWDRLDASHRRLVESFITGFNALGYSMSVERLPNWRHRLPVLAVRLDQAGDGAVLRLTGPTTKERRELALFDPNIQRHARLLEFLDHHPLVRRIELPGVVMRSAPPPEQSRIRPANANLPVRDTRRTHPRLGIIDGGISPALADWVIDAGMFWPMRIWTSPTARSSAASRWQEPASMAMKPAPNPMGPNWSISPSFQINRKPEPSHPTMRAASLNSSMNWIPQSRMHALAMACACST